MDKINNDNSISQHSKTFSFASIFLPNKIKYDVYKVYQFCRLYDEKIDRSRREEERKCFYECTDKETVAAVRLSINL